MVGSEKNRCEEIARDGDGLDEVWRDSESCGGTGRFKKRWGETGRGGEDQGAVGRDRGRWEGSGRGGKGKGEVWRDRETRYGIGGRDREQWGSNSERWGGI